jgi:uncharacterized protein YecA (UPF0149 family)
VSQRIFNIQFNVPQPTQRQQRQAAQQLQRAAAASRPQNLRASGGSAASAGKPAPVKTAVKVGRNDVCPWCDSGKKVKHCACEGARRFRGEI